ncbi:beta strand repeat-containing protein, partial [Helicobacter sp. 'house sparrow 1']|uniref:beta strand repeat-containing protein n=1 Tax=Helicobacter sp. 'house sparrow 1' TaxID=2020247 RepID=UPI0013151B17
MVIKNYLGGGEQTNTYIASSSSKIFKKSFFKPVVASSLALILGASFAQAQCEGSNSPLICAGIKGSESEVSNLVKWNATSVPSQAFIPLFHNTEKPISKLIFKFNNSGSKTDSLTSSESGTELTLSTTNGANSIILKGGGKGIQMDSTGKGTLAVDYNSQNDKYFTLDLSDAPDGIASFLGNIEIVNQGVSSGSNNNTFTATFKHDLQGEVSLKNASGNNTIKLLNGNLKGDITTQEVQSNGSENKLTIDFTNNGVQNLQANTAGRIIGNIYTHYYNNNVNTTITIKGGGLKGSIKNKTAEGNSSGSIGDLIVNFEDGAVMEGGNIVSGYNDFQAKIVTFKGASNGSDIVLTGDITSSGTGPVGGLKKENGNHVTFENGSMKGDVNAYEASGRAGYNSITFKDSNAKLEGNISAKGGINDSHSTNEISFEGDTNAIVGGSIKTGASSSKGGSAGANIITFKGTTKNNTITTTEGIGAYKGNNFITFEGSVSNKIEGNLITGATDYGSNGTNFVTFKSAAKNTIQGDVNGENGNNRVVMNGNNAITGIISAKGGYSGSNQFHFLGSQTTIGTNDSLSSVVSDTNATSSGTVNLLLFNSETNTLTLNELKANGNTKAINIISLDDTATKTASTSNITIKTMSASSGKNFIGKGILTNVQAQEVDASTLNLTDNTNSMSFVDATNAFVGNLSVSSVTSNNGVNNISFKASNTILASENAKATPQNAIIGSVVLNNDEA